MVLGTQHILVATDFSPASTLALDAGAMLARQFGARIHLVHVFDSTPMAPIATRGSGAGQLEVEQQVVERIQDELERLRTEKLSDIERVTPVVLQNSSAADAVCGYAAKNPIDLIVVSTHGRTGLAHFLIGSVAEKIVRHAPCPVLTLRSKA
jgi:nucleotide-binding universal stress UspA family protein